MSGGTLKRVPEQLAREQIDEQQYGDIAQFLGQL